MTVTTKSPLTESQQSLIDARLDTIDRMLMGRVPRSDRMAILGEIELQIHELLAEKETESLDREDILEVLRRLDPPEAYLNDENNEVFSRERPATKLASARREGSQTPRWSEGRLGGLFGIGSAGLILLSPLLYLIAIFFDSEIVLLGTLFTGAFLGIICSLISLVLSIRGRGQGPLPVVGMITGGIALPIWMLSAAFVVMSI